MSSPPWSRKPPPKKATMLREKRNPARINITFYLCNRLDAIAREAQLRRQEQLLQLIEIRVRRVRNRGERKPVLLPRYPVIAL